MLDPDQVRDAAREVAARITGKNVGDGECLISSGLIDSLSVVSLIVALEAKLSQSIPASSVQPDDFDTIDSIVGAVLRLRHQS